MAADTIADDPRTYRVYLAWFGPGHGQGRDHRVRRRGAARLREQGAVVFTWLGRGPLMAARRTEELLRAALGVPDRIPYARKRAVRGELPGAAERAAEVEELYGRAVALEGAGWPEALERLPFEAGRPRRGVRARRGGRRPPRVVTGLVDGGVVAGRLVAAAGPDLHLETAADGVVVLDTRLITGWDLVGADARAGLSVPVVALGGGGVQDGLF